MESAKQSSNGARTNSQEDFVLAQSPLQFSRRDEFFFEEIDKLVRSAKSGDFTFLGEDLAVLAARGDSIEADRSDYVPAYSDRSGSDGYYFDARPAVHLPEFTSALFLRELEDGSQLIVEKRQGLKKGKQLSVYRSGSKFELEMSGYPERFEMLPSGDNSVRVMILPSDKKIDAKKFREDEDTGEILDSRRYDALFDTKSERQDRSSKKLLRRERVWQPYAQGWYDALIAPILQSASQSKATEEGSVKELFSNFPDSLISQGSWSASEKKLDSQSNIRTYKGEIELAPSLKVTARVERSWRTFRGKEIDPEYGFGLELVCVNPATRQVFEELKDRALESLSPKMYRRIVKILKGVESSGKLMDKKTN